jgi:hypothetical protein
MYRFKITRRLGASRDVVAVLKNGGPRANPQHSV